jgi:bacterioferritin-associated ferredoxin
LLVCHCHRICDRTVRESIRQGARSIDEVGDACRAGTGCGGCRPAIAGLLAERAEAEAPARGRLSILVPFALPLAS